MTDVPKHGCEKQGERAGEARGHGIPNNTSGVTEYLLPPPNDTIPQSSTSSYIPIPNQGIS